MPRQRSGSLKVTTGRIVCRQSRRVITIKPVGTALVAYLGTTGSIVTNDLAYQERQAYTLTRGDAEFLHQYVVDTWTAQ